MIKKKNVYVTLLGGLLGLTTLFILTGCEDNDKVTTRRAAVTKGQNFTIKPFNQKKSIYRPSGGRLFSF
jgi:hypothetical protein